MLGEHVTGENSNFDDNAAVSIDDFDGTIQGTNITLQPASLREGAAITQNVDTLSVTVTTDQSRNDTTTANTDQTPGTSTAVRKSHTTAIAGLPLCTSSTDLKSDNTALLNADPTPDTKSRDQISDISATPNADPTPGTSSKDQRSNISATLNVGPTPSTSSTNQRSNISPTPNPDPALDTSPTTDAPPQNDAEMFSQTNEHEIEGCRVLKFNFLLNQLRDLSEHGECPFSDIRVEKEIRSGLDSRVILRCNNCETDFSVKLTPSEPVNMNTAAVLAINMVGIGYSQLEQFASVLDVPVMCAENYKKLNDDLGKGWEGTAMESMKRAADEEKKIAIQLGDVDDDGIPFTTVVIDGAYSKRSYNKNFTALSGVAAIVSVHTGKILWIGVRNKYCVTCVRSANKNISPTPEHVCTKNFTGPSSEMEWHSILEGFQCSFELHGIRYMKVIADGDSGTYQKLLEHKPYGDRCILKYECRNHLRRNYRKQLEPAITGCPRGLRDHVTKSLGRIVRDVNSATDYRSKEIKSDEEKVTLLKSDISNVIHHVFGDNSSCPSYILDRCDELDENYIPAMKTGTYEKLSQPTRRLMFYASDLLRGHTNNPAEHYNSIVAKFVGGKRINFSLSNSYRYKANAAAVQYNERFPLKALYRTKFQGKPPKLSTKVQLKRLRKTDLDKKRRKIRKEKKIFPKKFCRNKQKGTGYGVQPDLPPLEFQNEMKIFTEKLEKYQNERISIEQQTREKYRCPLREEVSRKLLLSSFFGSVCKARSLAGQVKAITHGSFV